MPLIYFNILNSTIVYESVYDFKLNGINFNELILL